MSNKKKSIKEILRKVFWPLFSSKTRGMGLGLTLSQMIIEKHGGKIMAESEPGEGTTFVMNLTPCGRTL